MLPPIFLQSGIRLCASLGKVPVHHWTRAGPRLAAFERETSHHLIALGSGIHLAFELGGISGHDRLVSRHTQSLFGKDV